MRKVICLFLASISLWGQTEKVAGKWAIFMQRNGDTVFTMRTDLTEAGGVLSGAAAGGELRGMRDGESVRFDWLQGGKVNFSMAGKISAQGMSGTMEYAGVPQTWNAVRIPDRPATPRVHDFTPTEFSRYFRTSPPVLRIFPGDSVKTWSVDAGGNDAAGASKSLGGNPLTGPFHIEGALPGDLLVVKFTKIRTNRDWARSGTTMISSYLSPDYHAQRTLSKEFSGRWKLDAVNGTAAPATPTAALQRFKVPLAPMLGCVGVAPGEQQAIRTSDSGNFGGNMDYNRVREGTTVYLPVYQPGALLFVGDGHAAQGAGELTGDALETSMDFEFTVDVIPGKSLGYPYAEDAQYLMMIGISGTLDDALRRATTAMARYLEREHGLTSNEAALVLGAAIDYDVADVVGTQVSIVAKLPRATLEQLPPRKQ